MDMKQYEIAKHLQISQAAVSLVLADPQTTRVSPEKKSQIIELLKANSYLNTKDSKKTWNILYATEKGSDAYCRTEYFYRAQNGIETVANQQLYNVILENYSSGKPLHAVKKNKVDGIIWESKSTHQEIAEMVAGYPTVLLNFTPASFLFDMVTADNAGAVDLAVRHLVELGHQRIAYLSGAPSADFIMRDISSHERYRGFLASCKIHQLNPPPEWISYEVFQESSDSYTLDHFNKVFARWREFPEAPTAAVCSNDYYASFLFQICASHGIRIPDDFSILGIDNLSSNSYFNLQLTSVDQNIGEMGRIAAELLFARMKNPGAPRQHIVCQSHLKVKKTTSRWNGGKGCGL